MKPSGFGVFLPVVEAIKYGASVCPVSVWAVLHHFSRKQAEWPGNAIPVNVKKTAGSKNTLRILFFFISLFSIGRFIKR